MDFMRSCDYITEDNLVFGANFNHISNGSYTQSHALIPTVLGVGSYDIAEDKINWEGYYKDDINCYCMASICDTKDGGAIVAATKACFDQAINYLSDIVLLKFSKEPSAIEDKSTCLNINVYPNPARNKISISAEDEHISSINFYNITGRLCKSVIVEENELQENISIADMKKGVYILQIKLNSGFQISKKLIVE